MLRYLSDEWISAMDEAVAGHDGLRDATRDLRLTVQQHVIGVDGDRSYHLWFDHGRTGVGAGAKADADVSFTCDEATAIAIATGAESAQTAFMAGRLRLGGDTRALMANQSVLANLDDVLAALRADTDFANSTTSTPTQTNLTD